MRPGTEMTRHMDEDYSKYFSDLGKLKSLFLLVGSPIENSLTLSINLFCQEKGIFGSQTGCFYLVHKKKNLKKQKDSSVKINNTG